MEQNTIIGNMVINFVGASNAVFRNNTLSGVGLNLDASSANNTFYWNNITSSAPWIANSNSSNLFNTTNAGNLYYFPNGTGAWSVFKIYDNNSDHWADLGLDRPFNATTVGGNWSGLGSDWFPYTNNTNHPPTILSSITFTNATAGHWFYANATAYDPAGGSDIKVVTINSTSGTCSQFSYTITSGNLSVVLNCTGTALASTTINMTFNDSINSTVSTSGSNTYPNQAPTNISSLLPNGGESFVGTSSNSISINWTNSTDVDNDSIVYWLYYSSNGGTSYTLITNTTSPPGARDNVFWSSEMHSKFWLKAESVTGTMARNIW